jgi:hypothetical protein
MQYHLRNLITFNVNSMYNFVSDVTSTSEHAYKEYEVVPFSCTSIIQFSLLKSLLLQQTNFTLRGILF